MTKLHVRIQQDDSSEHVWTPTQLQKYLTGIMENRGVILRIHGSDGTYIEVFPWYNTVKPIKDGLCADCAKQIVRHDEATA